MTHYALPHLTDGAIRNACNGDNMLREYQTRPGNRSRGWTKLTRIDARVQTDKRPVLDPLPAEKFDLWEAVGRR